MEIINMPLSVIIPTRNEENNIKDCLLSIKKQNFYLSGIEIIVVDNFSKDRTVEIAKQFSHENPELKVIIFNHGPERSTQRNFGIGKSRGDWLLFLDADMRLSANVMGDCLRAIEMNKDVVGLFIPEKIIGRGCFSKIRNFERGFYDGTVIDAPRFIKKSVFEKIGGFDENLYACEDWDLARRLKEEGNFEIIASPIFHDEREVTFSKYLRKKKYYGQNFSQYFHKWGRQDPDIRKQFGLGYRFWGVFLENGKWKKFFLRPDLALGVWLLKLLVGLNYLLFSKK